MLPSKTFYKMSCALCDSNFDACGTVKPRRIMEFLQDAAGEHAKRLGFGWDKLDQTGCLWVLSKMKIRFYRPVTRDVGKFELVTWPLKPVRFFAERCFAATDEEGKTLFQATSIWLVIDRSTRKIVSANALENIYNADFDEAHCDVAPDFERFRRDESFAFCYEKAVRRSDLDINGHVNNTNYIDYALDALDPTERVREAEIVYQKELVYGDTVAIYTKRNGNFVYVIGEKSETSFTVKLTLDN